MHLFWIILLVLLCTFAVLMLLVVLIWRNELRTMASLHQVDGNPFLYVMEYKTHYDLDHLVEQDASGYMDLLNYSVMRFLKFFKFRFFLSGLGEARTPQRVNCTSFQAARADGTGFLFGRNYDYYKNPTLVTISRPKKGYASIAVCDMSFMGYNTRHLPIPFIQRVNSLISIYEPLDGINEKGFCASIHALPQRFASQQQTSRHAVGTSTLLRLMLDRCATVEEAIALVRTVDVRHDPQVNVGFQYILADAEGNCAVLAFDPDNNWETMVTRKAKGSDHMQVTNHILDPKYYSATPDPSVGNTESLSWQRYNTADSYLTERNGRITLPQAQECLSLVRITDLPITDGIAMGTQYQLSFKHLLPVLETVHDSLYEDTQYSNVYDQRNIVLSLRNWNDYDVTHTFSLKK